MHEFSLARVIHGRCPIIARLHPEIGLAVPLSEGMRLGAYEIVGQIGAGGMGEVYRATDSKLGRDVAIKTLPGALAADKDRLARFEREAKLLASLHHAHIASVFSLDEHGGTVCLAMELVEGETLEQKLEKGALAVEDALPLALQIAEALEAAHAKGVVHRDLKPANVMVTPDGVVKVLDFGLAKAFSDDPTQSGPGQSPALSLAMTQAGLVLGTAGYMSPEQASGQPTDQRADVWSFGVVVYEMLTGLPLFSGESVPHILADVLKTEPDWSRLPANLHPRIRLLLERCLTKKPRSRYAGIADARTDIEAALQDPAGLTFTQPAAAAPASRPTLLRLAAAAALIVIGAAAALLVSWIGRPAEEAPVVGRFVLNTPPDAPFQVSNFNNDLVITPDGRHIVYSSGDPGIVSRALDSFETMRLSVIGSNPFVSPDSEWLGFFGIPSRYLGRIRVSGGPEIAFASFSSTLGPRGVVWLESGDIVFASFRPDGLWRVPSGGGDPVQITELDRARNENLHLWPSSLPGGEWILYTIRYGSDADAGAGTTSTIVLRNLATGEQRLLIEGGSDGRYVPTGHIVYGFDNTLRAVPFDPDRLEITGSPVSVLDGVMTTATGAAQFSFAKNGTMVYAAGTLAGDITFPIARVAPGSDEEMLPLASRFYGEPRLSPDGNRLAVVAASDIYIWSFEAANETRLTFEPGRQSRPVWSPDSQRVLYQSGAQDRSGAPELFARAASGAGSPELVYRTDAEFITPYAWLDDGRIVVGLEVTNGASDIAALTPGDAPVLEMLIATGANETGAALSRDGRFLAYQSDESGEPEIYVRPFPEVDSGRWQVSTSGGRHPVWSADGDRIFYVDPGQGIMASDVTTEPIFVRGLPRLWIPRTGLRLEEVTQFTARQYDVAADGEYAVVIKQERGAANQSFPEIVVVTNWFEELERLVPTD